MTTANDKDGYLLRRRLRQEIFELLFILQHEGDMNELVDISIVMGISLDNACLCYNNALQHVAKEIHAQK